MEKKFDIMALGEILLDFTTVGKSEQGNVIFEACPGGAVTNMLSMATRLGKKTAYIGKVGDDQFGIELRELLKDLDIDTSHLYTDPDYNTTLAFVHTFEGGEREFSFYRNPGADMMLNEAEINADFIKQTCDFHYGTLSMTHEGVRAATKKALDIAVENGIMLSFDPNLRPSLWKSLDEAKEQIKFGLNYCDILKISDNEIQFVTGIEDYDEGIEQLIKEYHIPLIFLTMGGSGSKAYYKGNMVEAGAAKCTPIENTGAGDSFCGSAVSYVLDYGLDNLTPEILKEILELSNAAAAIVTTRKGAMRAMPTPQEIEDLRKISFN